MSMAERKTMTRAVKNPVKRKLTRAEKKEIAAVIQAAKGDGKPHTAQQTMLVKYQNRIMALPMLCMIIIVLSACCFDEQKNETSNVNPKVQSVETVSVTRGNLTPTVSAHTTYSGFGFCFMFFC